MFEIISRISSEDAILLVLLLQMHIVVALNLRGSVVVHIFLLDFFCKNHYQRTPKLIPVSNLRLLKHVFSIMSLRLRF